MQPIAKITEHYARDPSIPADNDVYKRRFHLTEDEITLVYHYGEGRITCAKTVFTKDSSEVIQVDPLADPPSEAQLLELYQQLIQQEREVVQAVRDDEADVRAQNKTRKAEEDADIPLKTPYFDVIRETRDDSDDDLADDDQAQYDYLAPYMEELEREDDLRKLEQFWQKKLAEHAQRGSSDMDHQGTFTAPTAGAMAATATRTRPGQALSMSDAQTVRSNVMKSLTEYVLAREAIIKERIQDEKQGMAKKQSNFQRDRDQMTREDEAEYEKDMEKTMFRLHVLEQRLKRHQEESLLKFYELDQKLRKDARLQPWVVPTGK